MDNFMLKKPNSEAAMDLAKFLKQEKNACKEIERKILSEICTANKVDNFRSQMNRGSSSCHPSG